MKTVYPKPDKFGIRAYLAEVAKEKARMPFHGYLDGSDSNSDK